MRQRKSRCTLARYILLYRSRLPMRGSTSLQTVYKQATPWINWPTIVSVAVRISLTLTTSTFFQPDEYFQSLEVAHHAVFGYGHFTWEWLSKTPLRSPVYPAIYVPVYWLLKVAGLDESELLVGRS
jgi:hypothetical protein